MIKLDLSWNSPFNGNASSIAVNDQCILIGTENKSCILFDTNGNILQETRLDDEPIHMCIGKSGFYIRTIHNKIIYLDINFHVKWQYELDIRGPNEEVISYWGIYLFNDLVFAPLSLWKRYAVKALDESGDLKWYLTYDDFPMSLASMNNGVLVGIGRMFVGKLIYYNSRSDEVWIRDLPGTVMAVCTKDNRIYAGTYEGRVHCFDMDGNELWRTDCVIFLWEMEKEIAPIHLLMVHRNSLVATTARGGLLCFDVSGQNRWFQKYDSYNIYELNGVADNIVIALERKEADLWKHYVKVLNKGGEEIWNQEYNHSVNMNSYGNRLYIASGEILSCFDIIPH